MDAHEPPSTRRSHSPRTFHRESHLVSRKSCRPFSIGSGVPDCNQRRADLILDTEKRGSLCLAVLVERDQPGSMGLDSQNPSLLFFSLPRNDRLLQGLATPDL